jgi:hypothetical protein
MGGTLAFAAGISSYHRSRSCFGSLDLTTNAAQAQEIFSNADNSNPS